MNKEAAKAIVQSGGYILSREGSLTITHAFNSVVPVITTLPHIETMTDEAFSTVTYLGEIIFKYFNDLNFQRKVYPLMNGIKKEPLDVEFSNNFEMDVFSRMCMLCTILTGKKATKQDNDYMVSFNLLYAVFLTHFNASEEEIRNTVHSFCGGYYSLYHEESVNDYIVRLSKGSSLTE